MARILAVDGDPSVLALLQESLGSHDHSVVVCATAQEALAVLRLERFDCVLLNMVLPDGGGEDVLRAMRTMPGRAGIPVIAWTEGSDATEVALETSLGVVDHLAKPFPPALVAAAVDRALERPRSWLESRRHILRRGAEAHRDAERLNEKARASRVGRLIIDLRERRAARTRLG